MRQSEQLLSAFSLGNLEVVYNVCTEVNAAGHDNLTDLST